jgi:hypothetical protein
MCKDFGDYKATNYCMLVMVFHFLLKHLHQHVFLQDLIHIMNQQVLMVTIEIQHQHFSKQSLECIKLVCAC